MVRAAGFVPAAVAAGTPRPVRGAILWYEASTGYRPGKQGFRPLRSAPDRDCFALRLLLPRVAVLFIGALLALTGTTTVPGTIVPVTIDSSIDHGLSDAPNPDHRTLRAEAQTVAISVSRRSQLRGGTPTDQSPFILASGTVALPPATVHTHEQIRHCPMPDPVRLTSHAPRAPPPKTASQRIAS